MPSSIEIQIGGLRLCHQCTAVINFDKINNNLKGSVDVRYCKKPELKVSERSWTPVSTGMFKSKIEPQAHSLLSARDSSSKSRIV